MFLYIGKTVTNPGHHTLFEVTGGALPGKFDTLTVFFRNRFEACYFLEGAAGRL